VNANRPPSDNWLDALWWNWQSQDLDKRLTDMSGNDVPPADVRKSNNWAGPDPSVLFYDNNFPGNTTLDHVLYVGLIKNATVGEIMDVRGQAMCREYLYGDWHVPSM
jgi:tyrosinase